jgi:hypothetical protein
MVVGRQSSAGLLIIRLSLGPDMAPMSSLRRERRQSSLWDRRRLQIKDHGINWTGSAEHR